MPTVDVRPALPEDAAALAAVNLRSIRELGARDYPDPGYIARWCANKTEANFRAWIAHPEQRYFAGLLDGEIAGVGGVHVGKGWIYLLYLVPEAKGSGLGPMLLRRLEAAAAAHGHRTVGLESTISARRFYLREGFRELAEIAIDGHPAYRMEKALPEPQLARAAMLIRPVAFHGNPQTQASNAFQRRDGGLSPDEAQARALAEFEGLVRALDGAGVRTCVFDDTREPATPDAIFPNNWVSFHPDGRAVLYPMMAPNRRRERRPELLDRLAAELGLRGGEVLDLAAGHEAAGRYLEGTGSLVLDRAARVAYACRSPRTHPDALTDFAARMGYTPLIFDAVDAGGTPIYHTNVMMNVGRGFAVVGAAAIADPAERAAVLERLAADGHEVVALSPAQLAAFAGNMLALAAADGSQVLALSARAERALTPDQRATLSRHARLVAAPVDTIEDLAGGSVRCMIAEVFWPPSVCNTFNEA